ncbi:MAG: DUF1517 domain-containing protein [Kofleriaceae bacterium]
MKWILWVVLACATAWAGGSGGRMGGSSFKSSSTPSRSGTSSSSKGSYGGGNWSSHSSSSSSSSSSFGGGSHWSDPPSHSSSSSSSYHYTNYSGTPSSSSSEPYSSSNSYASSYDHPYDASHGFKIFLLVVGILICLIALIVILKPAFSSSDFAPSGNAPFIDIVPSATSGVDVSVLRVVVDGRARTFVQDNLKRIASSADTSTGEGRIAMLREVALMLRRLRDAWIYGGAVNEPIGSSDTAQRLFDRHVDAARAKFSRETITNVDGVMTGSTPDRYVARSDEGAGVILVSVILAADRELFTVQEIGSGNDLSSALESAGHLDENSLVAVEIIWQPSEDADRLTSIELEAQYPHPALIKIRGALVGKVFCGHCSGPFPAELTSCPHCGAPSRESA